MIPLLHKISAIVMIGMTVIGGAWRPQPAYALPAAAGATASAWPVIGDRCPWVVSTGGGKGGGGGQEFLTPASAPASAVLSRLRGHKDVIDTVAYSPNGRLIATSDGNDTRLWDAAGGNQLLVLSDPKGVSSPQFSPDSRLIGASVNEKATWLTSGRGQVITKVWDAGTGREKLSVTNGVIAGFSPDSKTVAVAVDGAVQLHDIATGARKRVLKDAAPPVRFSPDGKTAATVVPSGKAYGIEQFRPESIVLWDIASGSRLRELGAAVKLAGQELVAGEKGHARVGSLAFSADGKRLLSTGSDTAARLWDVATGQHLRCFRTSSYPDSVPTRGEGGSPSILSRPDALLVAALDGSHIYIWNATANRIEETFEIPFFAYQAYSPRLTLSPDPQQPRLLTWYQGSMSEAGRTALVWDLDSAKLVGMFRQPGWLSAAALAPDTDRATVAYRYDVFDKAKTAIRGEGEAWIWDLAHADVTLAAAAGDFLTQGVAAAAAKDPAAQSLFRKAQALNPDPDFRIDPAVAQHAYAGTLMAAGHALAQAGDMDAATLKFQQALNLAPNLGIVPEVQARQDYAEDLKNRAELLAQIGEYEAAVANFRLAHDLDPTLLIEPELDAGWAAARALMAQGENLAERGDVKDAAARFQEAQLYDPLLAVTPDDRARRIFNIARARELVAEGYALAQAGDLEGAAATYSRALTFDPLLKIESYQEPKRAYGAALVQQGSKLARSGDTKGAAAKFAQALTVDPTLAFDPTQKAAQDYASAFVSNGYDLAYAGDVEGAIAKFRQALTIDPTQKIEPELQAKQLFASVLRETAWALAAAGNVDSAIATYRRAADLDPTLDIQPEQKARADYGAILKVEAQNLAQGGDLDGAAEIYKRALALDPTLGIDPEQEARAQYAGAIKSAADMLARSGETELAVAKYSEALALNPSLNIDPSTEAVSAYINGSAARARALTWRADDLAGRGDLNRAAEIYWEALALDPTLGIDPEQKALEKYASGLMGEAGTLFSSGVDDAAAVVYLERAVEILPYVSLSAFDLKNLCWWGSLLGRDPRFLAACDAIVAGTPNDTSLQIRRAFARALTGDFAGAIADLQYTIQQDATRTDQANDIAVRQNWIQLLQSGRDAASIFPPSTLKMLRQWEWR